MMSGVRLLIVEDDRVLSQLWSDIFTEFGADIIGPCASVAHALELLRSTEPDLALLDLQVGDDSSFEVARILQDTGIPFVFLSGRELRDLPPEFSTVPSLRKPVTARQLVAALSEHFAKQGA